MIINSKDIVFNEQQLRHYGFKPILGLKGYMIKGGEVRSVGNCKKLTIQHHGRINVTDNRGKRTTVKVANLRGLDE